MKIELKDVNYNEVRSEDSYCYSATLWVDGLVVALCVNDGRGGITKISPYKARENKLREAKAYADSLPPIDFQGSKLDMNLEFLVNQLMSDYLFETKILKKYQKYNVVASKDKINLSMNFWYYEGTKRKIPIDLILKNDDLKSRIIDSIKEFHAEGLTVHNTNIPKELIESLKEEKK